MYSLLHDPETGAASDRLVRRDADAALIPNDPDNADWQAYEAWRAEGNAPAAPAPAPASVPDRVEDWQFAGQAAEEGIITRAEALEWSGPGVVPPTLVRAVDRLITDQDQHFKVMIFLRGASGYPRHHPLVPLLGRVFGKDTDAALDAFWIAAGAR